MLAHRPSWLPPDDALERFYGNTIAYPYYRLQVTQYISRLMPESGSCSVIDVGAGDGYLGSVLRTYRPQTSVVGVETQIREHFKIGFPLVQFDGRRLPFGDNSFDLSLLCNVLHHADDQTALLREVCRVTRRRVIIKDHLAGGTLDRLRLAVLDILGNLRFAASTTGSYLSARQWAEMFSAVGGPSVTTYEGLSFRRGWLASVFSNSLEILFALDLDPVSAPSMPAAPR